jgi:hypothetical protein
LTNFSAALGRTPIRSGDYVEIGLHPGTSGRYRARPFDKATVDAFTSESVMPPFSAYA